MLSNGFPGFSLNEPSFEKEDDVFARIDGAAIMHDDEITNLAYQQMRMTKLKLFQN